MSKDNYEILKKNGNELFKSKKYESALLAYSDAIKAKGDEAVAYCNRALCHIHLNQYFQAIDDCNKAIELDKGFAKAYYRRATAAKELSRYQSALEDFSKAYELDSSSSHAQKEAATIKKLLKDDTRIHIKPVDKPATHISKVPLKTFELGNQYSGLKSYR